MDSDQSNSAGDVEGGKGVKLTLRLTREQWRRLQKAIEDGLLEEFNVVQAEPFDLDNAAENSDPNVEANWQDAEKSRRSPSKSDDDPPPFSPSV